MSWISLGFGMLALLSLALSIWQFIVAMRFPLHQRVREPGFAPGVTVLKPLKGCDADTEDCLRSWLVQNYDGEVQILFGITSAGDAACRVVEKLLKEFPRLDAQLVECARSLGANAKVSTLAQLEPHAKHELILTCDADVRVSPDFLANVVFPMRNSSVGLVNCLYRLANPSTLAMRLEAIAINADFWSQVLQARSLKWRDFALGAVMLVRRTEFERIGGFAALVDYLADDYQLGSKIFSRGQSVEFCPVVVDCLESRRNWTGVLKHQLRYARTIRFCKPVPYFFSILGNPTLWSMCWLFTSPVKWGWVMTIPLLLWRIISAQILQKRFSGVAPGPIDACLVPLKDLLAFGIWLAAFISNKIAWRDEIFQVKAVGRSLAN